MAIEPFSEANTRQAYIFGAYLYICKGSLEAKVQLQRGNKLALLCETYQ